MVVGEAIHNIMGGIENTGTLKQHSHKKKLRQRFDIIKKLGQGTFGKVQLGINKETGQEVAIKTIKKSKIDSEADLVRIRREIQIMSSVQHPNIIHIYEVFENREKMVLVMEYAAGGELYDYLSERKVLDEEEARRIFRQIATACYYCHKHKICHRDLKLENILLDENNNAKIADFGLSNVFDEQRLLNTFCGSPLYASPEIVKGTPYHGPEVDCWSLGVLLYTLVYGAMPFDGSNFKRLVKQISQGDYFEPAKPSPASPLIREMLTVNPKHRADIEKICSHWWVNEGYDDSCLEISEELANQTPVRLDVLLSLAPPPPQLESEKLMLTGEERGETIGRSQSAYSIMDMTMDMLRQEKAAAKRKLEITASTDRANVDKRKEKIVKESTVADVTTKEEPAPLDRSSTQTLSKEMDVETTVDPCLQGAVCSELIEESEKKKEQQQQQQQQQQQAKVKRTLSTSVSEKIPEEINENPSQENLVVVGKENVKAEPPKEEKQPKKTVVKKKVLKDKNDNTSATPKPLPLQEEKKTVVAAASTKEEKRPEPPEQPAKPIERRKSRIFEAAEKFQNLIKHDDTKPTPIEKPKKIIIPGVSVDGFKREFERKASLTSTSPPKPKGALTKKDEETTVTTPKDEKPTDKTEDGDDTMKERVRNAVSIISSALDKEGTRKSKSRPCMVRKPPVPFGASGRSASGNIGVASGPRQFVRPEVPDEEPIVEAKAEAAEEAKQSATLPRRKTLRAEITLNYPMPTPTNMIIKTEFGHETEGGETRPTIRGEIIVPLGPGFRPKPVAEPQPQPAAEQPVKSAPSRERIIPISFEAEEKPQEGVQSPPAKPPVPKPFQTQQSNSSQGSNLSRQSTQESDTETQTSTGEPIKKSPREYIIPIAVEGGGYVTPRAGSLEPSDTSASTMTSRSKGKFGRGSRRLNSFFNDRDSEDESSPFSSLHRRGSIGKDSDNEDSKRDIFHMHRLRSTRPKRSHLEHNDSLSSGEDDDDEGFEILTAENLFSTLLSRVRDLTQRLNVDDGVRPGFPNSRLLSHFDRGSNFWNRMDHPLSRHSSLGRTLSGDRPTVSKTSTGSSFGVPWRRTVSRDTSSEGAPTSPSPQRPIGDMTQEENLNLADLNLKKLKLSDEDALALSYLTPGLSRRIQQQLLSQLAPREARKLHRTMSSRIPEEREQEDRPATSTLPRNLRTPRSFLPVKRDDIRPSYDFAVRSSSIGAEPRGDSRFLQLRPKTAKSPDPETYSGAPSRPYSKYSKVVEPDNRFKTLESDRPSKRISRFLRPDFFDPPKEENVYLKEKKEREMETQKVLKEIRDKRRSRMRRERSQSKEKQAEELGNSLESSLGERQSNIKYPDGLEQNRSRSTMVNLEQSKTKHLEDSLRYSNSKYLTGGLEQSKSTSSRDSLDQSKSTSSRDSLEQIKTKQSAHGSKYPDSSLEQNKDFEDDSGRNKGSYSEKGSLEYNLRQNNSKYSDGGIEQNKSKSSRVSLDQGKSEERQKSPKCLDGSLRQTKPKQLEDNDLEQSKTKHLEDIRQKRGNFEPNGSKRLEDDSEQHNSLDRNKERSPKDSLEQNNPTYPYNSLEQNNDIPSNDEALRYSLEQNKSERLKDSLELDRTKHPEVTSRQSNLNTEQNKSKHHNLENSLEYNKDRQKRRQLENGSDRVKKEEKLHSYVNVPGPKIHDYVNVKAAPKVSKIARPKSYPIDNNVEKPTKSSPDKESKISRLRKGFTSKQSKERTNETNKSINEEEKQHHKNKLLHSIEKKLEKLRSSKEPDEKSSCGVENAIKRLREQSLPRNIEPCTESGLIKRAVSVEDLTGSKPLQTSRKSVTKILGLFKKYEEQDNNNKKKTVKKVKSKDKTVVNNNNDASESSQSERLERKERPRSLFFEKVKGTQDNSDGMRTMTKSKLPVNSYRRSLNLEPNGNDEERPSRRDLRLELSKPNEPTTSEDRNSLTTDDSSTATLLSPSEDYMSCDSWSVCSDLHSPLSPNGNSAIYSGDEGESVIDRIRRKSFYTRFNEKRRSRRPVSSSFKELDSYRRSSTGLQEPRAYGRPYTRTGSLLNDYINVPDHYQPYGARAARTQAPLRSEEDALDELISNAKAKKYSSHIQPTRLGRTSGTPVSDYYMPRSPSSEPI